MFGRGGRVGNPGMFGKGGRFGSPGMLGRPGKDPGGKGGALGSEEEEQAQPTLESPKLSLWLARLEGLGHRFCIPTVGFGRETRHRKATMIMILFMVGGDIETKYF